MIKVTKSAYVGVILWCFAAVFSVYMPAMAAAQQHQDSYALAQSVLQKFSSIRTMTGDFVQTGPQGERSTGSFYIERPGKVRFSYENSDLRIIADGRSVAVNNRSLDSWDLYQLSQTPLKLLWGEKVSLSRSQLAGVSNNKDTISIVLSDKSLGEGKVTLVFDSKTYALQEWTIIDRQNLPTHVRINNVRTGVRFATGMFTIPYQDIAMKRKS